MIMVAGEPSDFEEVKEAIVELSHYPCSLTFVGMTDSEFE